MFPVLAPAAIGLKFAAMSQLLPAARGTPEAQRFESLAYSGKSVG
jgi:hypothetical protein